MRLRERAREYTFVMATPVDRKMYVAYTHTIPSHTHPPGTSKQMPRIRPSARDPALPLWRSNALRPAWTMFQTVTE